MLKPILLVLLAGASALCQPAPEPLKFEVASIKEATSGINGVRGGCRGIDTVVNSQKTEGLAPLGRCVITDGRLSHLIGMAFGVSMQNLDTEADWIQRGTLRFDVQAKAEDPAKTTEKQLITMLQNLLIERFQLKFHYTTTDQSGFSLSVAKNGPKLAKSTADEPGMSPIGKPGTFLKPGGPGRQAVSFRKFSMQNLVELLSAIGNYGPGKDNTGLTGEYDFDLTWSEEDGPALGTALRDQLGLVVKAEKVQVKTFVVDSAQKPAAN